MAHKAEDSESTERFVTKKSLGQHFLNSGTVPNWLCDAGAVTEGDIVVEWGPGTGALTVTLLERGATVYALEADERALAVLTERFASYIETGKLILKHADARTFSIDELPLTHPYKVVANIPYYLSGWLLRTTLGAKNPPQTVVFLMQKEMVERITRDPKSSLLALSVAVYGTPRYVKTVGRGHFTPPPKVDSAILSITNISHTQLPTKAATEHFFTLLHLGFGQKRKQLRGNLSAVYERTLIEQCFASLGIKETARGEDLNITTWLALARELPPLSSELTE